jgi:lysine 2,3-aminomutase
MNTLLIGNMNQEPTKTGLSAKSARRLKTLLRENPRLEDIYNQARSEDDARYSLRAWAEEVIADNQSAQMYYRRKAAGPEIYAGLRWKDLAAIRILDYLDHAGREFTNPFRAGKKICNDPFQLIWLGVKTGSGGAKPLFFEDMIQLFRQLTGQLPQRKPDRQTVLGWMTRWKHGLEPDVTREREANKERIIQILIDRIESCEPGDRRYAFKAGMTRLEKLEQAGKWWDDYRFHLRFAVRSPALLNELLDCSLDSGTRKLLDKAKAKGIPFFVNPYYLSLLSVKHSDFAAGSDLAIRHYVIYSEALVDQFGNIQAWEKEDKVKPGRPNAAGWLLPSTQSVHRRYPQVAILIPDTMGRACGGLCVSCQRMYDFQRGNLGFNLEKLKPDETWEKKLRRLLDYYEKDTQLRDILITGGDALMSRDQSLENILDAVYEMAVRKKEANQARPDGEKYAEIVRIRLGTRLLAYLPQRVTPQLAKILGRFRNRALQAGLKQFVIQTHFESPIEVTPEARQAVRRLLSAGWMVVNQLVFTTAASRRGHTAMLRKVLNDIGVITYYTFSVKGFLENTFNYATNARAVQEQDEEKCIGRIPERYRDTISAFPFETQKMVENIARLRQQADIPFMATDRNVMNLPGIGKSMTFRTIGLTRWGRRILEFDHDHNRWHSPIIDRMGKIIIIESKPVGAYLHQLEEMGENVAMYQSIWGYSIGETEPRPPLFEYPRYDFGVTKRISNLELND